MSAEQAEDEGTDEAADADESVALGEALAALEPERAEWEEFAASEMTLPDESVSKKVTEASAAEPSPAPSPGSDLDQGLDQGLEIPAPKLRGGEGQGLDPLAAIAMLAFVLVGGLLVFGFARALVPAAEAQLGAACRPLSPEPRSGEIPELELEDLDGNPVSLADYSGKFLVVNFWATWCEPCTREWPDLDVLGERLGSREDIEVLAISVDQEPGDIGPYLERMGLQDTSVTILRARSGDAHKQFGSEKIPDTYFVSPTGEMQAVFVNTREWGQAKAVRCVEASADQARP